MAERSTWRGIAETVTISSKGWIVIPKEMRRKHGLTAGRRVTIVDRGGQLSLHLAPDDPIAAMDGMFAELGGPSWTEAIVEEHRRDRAREDGEWRPPSS